MKRITRIVAVGATALLGIAPSPTAASAASYSMNVWTSSTGSVVTSTASRSLAMSASISDADWTANQKCLDVFFDWKMRSGHYDSRMVRRCQAGDVSNSVWNDNFSNRSLSGDGTNKLGRCTTTGVDASGYGGKQSCVILINKPVGNCSPMVKYTACYVRNGATLSYWDGGDPQSSTA